MYIRKIIIYIKNVKGFNSKNKMFTDILIC